MAAMFALRHVWTVVLIVWPLVGFVALSASEGAPRKAAVFDLELLDTSLEGTMGGLKPDEAARLKLLSHRLRQDLAVSGQFEVVDVAPVAAEAGARKLFECGGCEVPLARRVGADLAITGVVQKVSNLLLSLHVTVRDAAGGQVLAEMNAEFRGNTDESWQRALSYLVRNRLLQPNFGGS